ncbi:hypothetical protein G7026_04025 [Pseudomonas azotifigens]|uniref:Lipoprotein n=1 Tax=Stutzerimonas azotifigens TaxID=291995 RepID=A0ABR5YX74_9GAMM|nr:hypothetical protein [Stutzerimonas azotifigens]
MLFALSACSTTPPGNDASQPPLNPAIAAFRSICLETAPSFAGASAAARQHGIDGLTDMGFVKLGVTADKSIGVQVKENSECAVTTPSQPEEHLTRQFLETIADTTGGPAGRQVPIKVSVGGQTFLFTHDRNGGEAYVMLRPEP